MVVAEDQRVAGPRRRRPRRPRRPASPPGPRAGRCRGTRWGAGSAARSAASPRRPAHRPCGRPGRTSRSSGRRPGRSPGSSISRPPISEPFVFIQAGGLHGVATTVRSGFSAQRLAQQRQDPRPVVGDGEVLHRVVRLARRARRRRCRSRRPRSPRHPSAGAAPTARRRGGLNRSVIAASRAAGREPVQDDGGGVGDRGAEAAHRLVAAGRVDRDRQLVGAAGREGRRGRGGQALGAVRGGDPHPDRWRVRGGRRCGTATTRPPSRAARTSGTAVRRRTTAGPPGGPTLCPICAVLSRLAS